MIAMFPYKKNASISLMLNGILSFVMPCLNSLPKQFIDQKYPSKPSLSTLNLAIVGKSVRNPFQLLWDYFARNMTFWSHYHKDLKVKYIFLVNEGRVCKMDFNKFLLMSSEYVKCTKGSKLSYRQKVAKDIVKKYFNNVYKNFYQEWWFLLLDTQCWCTFWYYLSCLFQNSQ